MISLKEIMEFAYSKHEGQMYGNKPYAYHLDCVANKVREKGLYHVCLYVAYLHDILEDTDTTYQDLIRLGIGYEIAEAVLAITKMGKERRKDYLFRVKQNLTAKYVKICDSETNAEHCLRDGDVKRYEYYLDTIKFLEE